MKKIVCLLMCLCLVFSFAACGKDGKKEEKKEEKGETVDLEYYVRLGKIPECDYVIGAAVDDIIEQEGAYAEPGEERYQVTYNNVYYYYQHDVRTVEYIVSFNGAYGFSIGTTNSQLKAELAKGDMNAKEEPLSEEEPFFIPAPGNFTGIKYTYGDHTTCFVFNNGVLCACTMY